MNKQDTRDILNILNKRKEYDSPIWTDRMKMDIILWGQDNEKEYDMGHKVVNSLEEIILENKVLSIATVLMNVTGIRWSEIKSTYKSRGRYQQLFSIRDCLVELVTNNIKKSEVIDYILPNKSIQIYNNNTKQTRTVQMMLDVHGKASATIYPYQNKNSNKINFMSIVDEEENIVAIGPMADIEALLIFIKTVKHNNTNYYKGKVYNVDPKLTIKDGTTRHGNGISGAGIRDSRISEIVQNTLDGELKSINKFSVVSNTELLEDNKIQYNNEIASILKRYDYVKYDFIDAYGLKGLPSGFLIEPYSEKDIKEEKRIKKLSWTED